MRKRIQAVLETFCGVLAGSQGLAYSFSTLRPPDPEGPFQEIEEDQLRTSHLPAELSEQTRKVRFPQFAVYCDRAENSSGDRFHRHSGSLRVVTEVRMSQDRVEELTERLTDAVDAVCDVIERSAGCVAPGIYLEGTFEATLDPVRKGGLSFSQSARVSCPVRISN